MSKLRAGGALALGVVVLVALARAAAPAVITGELRARGLRWTDEDATLTRLRWTGITGEGVTVGTLTVDLLPPHVKATGVDVDLAALPGLRGGAAGAASGGGAGARAWISASVEDLQVRWGDHLLAQHLRGPLLPEPVLRGDGVAIDRVEGAWTVDLHRPIEHEWLRGEADWTLRLGEARTLHLSAPAVVLAHPDLSRDPLPPTPLVVDLAWGADHALSGTARYGGVEARVEGTLALSPRAWDLTLTVPPTPLGNVVALFGDQIPEAEHATFRGTVGLRAHVTGPELSWSVTPTADGLGADGVIPDPDSYLRGSFRYPVLGGMRETGDDDGAWVPRDRLYRLGQAVVASEDSGFWTHPGYDLDAIQEALDTWATGEERPRGGSTLTQQLAKNLFLDGDRTLVRKLRELLLALELERRLGKDRILELYLNVVELGPDLYGAGPACEMYFLKQPEGLSWKEAALLAAILPAPRTYAVELWAGRQPTARVDRVLEQLVRLHILRPEEARLERSKPVIVLPQPLTSVLRHFGTP